MGFLDLLCASCGTKLTKDDCWIISKETKQVYQTLEEYQRAEGKALGFDYLCVQCAQKSNVKSAMAKLLPMTTTANFEGKAIIEYRGVITAQVFIGINIFRDFFSGIRDIVGGRSKAMEKPLRDAKEMLLRELAMEAVERQGNAIVGLKIDFETVGPEGSAFMLLGSGTAVVIKDGADIESLEAILPELKKAESDDSWYFQDESGKHHGPVSVEELKDLYGKGEVKVNTTVWKKTGIASFLDQSEIFVHLKDKS